VPPTVAITNPPDGSVFSAPATINLSATASDTDGSVTNVQFFQGTISLGNVATSPYMLSVQDLGAGDYAFSGVATDNNGSKATNLVTVHVVTAVPIVLSAFQQLSPARIQFSYSANVGLRYVAQRSADLATWTALGTNTAKTGSEIFLDQNASGNPGFYRVGRLPNP
jgi:hypothetical protein